MCVPPRPIKPAKLHPLHTRAEPALAPAAHRHRRALLSVTRRRCRRQPSPLLPCPRRQRRVKVYTRHVSEPEALVELAHIRPVRGVPLSRHEEEMLERRAGSQTRELERLATSVAARTLDFDAAALRVRVVLLARSVRWRSRGRAWCSKQVVCEASGVRWRRGRAWCAWQVLCVSQRRDVRARAATLLRGVIKAGSSTARGQAPTRVIFASNFPSSPPACDGSILSSAGEMPTASALIASGSFPAR